MCHHAGSAISISSHCNTPRLSWAAVTESCCVFLLSSQTSEAQLFGRLKSRLCPDRSSYCASTPVTGPTCYATISPCLLWSTTITARVAKDFSGTIQKHLQSAKMRRLKNIAIFWIIHQKVDDPNGMPLATTVRRWANSQL